MGAHDPRFPGAASSSRHSPDLPPPAEVARALDLAVQLLLANGHAEEGRTLIRMAESMVGEPAHVRVAAPSPLEMSASIAAPHTESPRFHDSLAVVVKEGDSLSSLAMRFYGDSRQWRTLAEANDLLNQGELRVGQFLRIPALDRAGEAHHRYRTDVDPTTVEDRVQQLEKRLEDLQQLLERLVDRLSEPERPAPPGRGSR